MNNKTLKAVSICSLASAKKTKFCEYSNIMMAENASSALRQIKEEHLLEIIKILGGIEHLESIPSSERP